MPAILATDGGAARTRHALVACAVADVAEVGTARALQEVAAHGRLVAHLRARRVQERLRDDGKLLGYARVRRDLRHGGGRANRKALRSCLDPVVEKTSKAYQSLRPANVFLEQLHHVGTAGDIFS